MKKLFINTLCLLTCIQLSAQMQNQIASNTSKKENGIWLEFESVKQISAAELVQNKTALRLGTNDDLSPITIQEDHLGYRHHRYQQTYKGIPVEDAIFILHEKNSRVAKANGNLIADLNILVIPAISEVIALQAALQHVNATTYAWQNATYENLIKDIKNAPNATFYPEGKLLIINAGQRQKTTDYKLAYKFDIYALEPESRQYVYIDAQTCEVLMTEERMHNCTDPAFGVTNYSQVVNFTACQDNNTGQYTLKNAIGGGGMQVFDAVNTNNTPLIPFTDTDNFFDSTPTANEVHWAVEKTRDYYLTEHNRQGIDDNNMPICSWIRYQRASGNRNNAYWNGMFLQFGDGDGINYTSFTSPDIVAHEYTHGVTDYTANLRYHGEHGALNESFSDIFGEVAERYMRGTNDWVLGADFVINPNFNGIRNMSNPKDATMTKQQPDTYLGINWYASFNDNGGVHTNSGVQNYWFYLLAEGGSGVSDNGDVYDISGIGIDKAAAIAYRNLAFHLTSVSEYADARAGAIQAAEDLYGVGSNEALQTGAAWCAVGVGNCSVSCRYTDSLALVALYNSTNGLNWTNLWDLNQPIDEWYGVTLNEDGCVAQLSLSANQLSGMIPIEIGNLSNLKQLSLFGNQLSGTIPSEIGNLDNLTYLFLSNNELDGTIPPNLGNLSNLIILFLSDNQLDGMIPPELGNLNNLEKLYLDGNELEGTIPPELGNLSNLTILTLFNNQLDGCYDANLLNLSVGFNSTISDGNNFDATWETFRYNLNGSGACSEPVYEDCHQIDSLLLMTIYNALGGVNSGLSWNPNQPLYTWSGVTLNGFGCVTRLSLSNDNLSGSIPSEIGGLSSLRYLYLHTNNFTGNIPPEIGDLNHLRRLDLYNNQLNGCYDDNLIDLCSKLYSLYNTNTRISDGNNFDIAWEDFCDTGVGGCNYSMETVYPGDFNNDGTANTIDLLYWGLVEGSIGYPRPTATSNWTSQTAYWWEAVHEDGNGDGIVDFNDIAVLVQNYDSTYLPIPPYTPNQGLINYELKLEDITYQPRRLHFALYATSKTGGNLSTHGLAGTVDFSLLDDMSYGVEPEIDTTNSALESKTHLTHYDYLKKQLHFALTKTDKNNQLLDTSRIATFIVTVDDLKVGEETEYIVSARSGSLMSANGAAAPVGATTLAVSISNSNGGADDIIAYIVTADEQCNLPGWAKVVAQGGSAPYTYQWSNGAVTDTINNLTAGIYTVTINDALGNIQILSSEVQPPDPIYDEAGNQILCDNIVCPLDLPLNGVISNSTYRATNTITSTGTIPQGGNVSCKAGGQVIMEIGCSVENNANFSAEIEDCGGF